MTYRFSDVAESVGAIVFLVVLFSPFIYLLIGFVGTVVTGNPRWLEVSK